MADLVPAGDTTTLTDSHTETVPDLPWQVVLWNDPVNSTGYVTATLMRILRIDAAAAERLMLTAHVEGKAAVKSGQRPECETVVTALGAATLWATIEKVTA